MSDVIQVNPLVFGGNGGVTIPLAYKLWENPTPTVAFPTQNITLSSDDYDFLIVESAGEAGSSPYCSALIVEKGKNILLFNSSGYRAIVRNSDTSFTVRDCGVGNQYIVPLIIYGMKKSYDIEDVAIAEVSTSASRCMLEDGVTNVEQAITELQDNAFSTPVDISGYTSGNNFYTTPSDGYLSIYVNADNTHTTVAIAGKGKTNTQYLRVRHSGSNSAEYGMLYVKKGMLLWIDQSTDTGASRYIQFVPLT